MRADAVQQLRDVHGPDRVLELLPGLFRLPIPLPRNKAEIRRKRANRHKK